ncbi:MAG: acyl-ACP--UDP-N-acetylglucosamine O-acyltransferase, partial [Campylobacterales bacterium]|nr:acyl-ACP--UDP-N-acetylglucosamine O-acyltransferase [Campylobacterales bacterium]
NNKIYAHAVIGATPQDLKYKGEETELIIGDNNVIREFCFFNTGTPGGGGVTKIGSNSLFMAYVHIAHDCVVGNNCILANNATLAGHVHLGNFAVIGGMTPVHQFVSVGDFAMLAGASAISQDIPPYCLAEGNRAKLRGLNLVGLRRNLDRSDVDELKRAYRELFLKQQPLKEVAAQLAKSDNVYVQNIAKFCLETKRGIPYHQKETVDIDE